MKHSAKSAKKRQAAKPLIRAPKAKKTPVAKVSAPKSPTSVPAPTPLISDGAPTAPARVPGRPGPLPGHGRGPTLTQEIQDKIVELMAAGMPDTHCGPLLVPPLDRTIISLWKAKGAEVGAKPIYVNFLNALRAAKARRLHRNLALVMIAANQDWRAALAMAKIDASELFAEKTVNYTPEEWDAFTKDQLAKVANGRNPYE